MTTTIDFPPARQIIPICAWCPDKEEREAQALREHPGAMLSHGCCLQCAADLREEHLNTERTSS